MNTRGIFSVLAVACGVLLFPARLPSQRPPAPGRLSVTSNPVGALIWIDGQWTQRITNFTFVVSPGAHSVLLQKAPRCPKATQVSVASGQTVSVHCGASGWETPVYK